MSASDSTDPQSPPSSTGPAARSRRAGPDPPGPSGEALARTFLEAKGFRVVAADHRWGRWQADLLAWDGRTPVVVEVKSRRGWNSRPEAGLTTAQATRLLTLARAYFRVPWVRLDLVTVRFSRQAPPQVDHFPGLRILP